VLRLLDRFQGMLFVAGLTTALFATGLADCVERAFFTQRWREACRCCCTILASQRA